MRITILLTLISLLAIHPAGAAILINEYQSSNETIIEDEDGDYPDWIELYNSGGVTVDLDDFGLSDDLADPLKWTFPDVELPPGEYLLIFASGKGASTPGMLRPRDYYLHTNFKLSSTGEPLLLSDPAGVPLDLVGDTALPMDISRGRYPDGSDQWRLFTGPTPDRSNDDADPYFGIATEPVFLRSPGFYSTSATIPLAVAVPPALTYYTLDGSIPGDPGNEASHPYTNPIQVDTTTVIRARTLLADHLPSPVITSSYFIDEEIDLPVVSITTDPQNFWDHEYGILAMGPNADPNHPYYGANFYEDWERPIHMEYFDTSGQLGFKLNSDTKVHGGSSRVNPQKSLAILARDEYGVDHIEYPIFRTRELTSFKRLVVRNNGQDFEGAHCRDGLASRIIGEAHLERMAYEPVVVFINGMYWGLEGLREKLDKYFLHYHYGIDPDSIIAMEGQNSAIYHTTAEWNTLIDFIESEDLSLPANYEIIKGMMEVENFALYNVHEIFMGNLDWPNHNIKRWRPYADGGRWRWLFFDLDNSQGGPLGADYNYLRNAIYDDGWPPGWSTVVMRGMLESPEFVELFANTWADELGSRLRPERTLAIIDQVVGEIAGEIPRHRQRWDIPMIPWEFQIDDIIEFYQDRPAYALEQLMTEFALTGTWQLDLDISPPGAGSITLTSLTVDSTWSGAYFDGIGVPLTATPHQGYTFQGWQDPGLPQVPQIILPPGSDRQVTALFAESLSSAVVINEINYHSADEFDPGDWVELHNPSSAPLDISGWKFKDGDDQHTFILPQGAVIQPWGFVVLADDLVDFSNLFPEVSAPFGPLGFSFSGSGEMLRLLDESDVLIDSVFYDDSPPWPPEADGLGATLELINAATDNALPESWSGSAGHGTPGDINSVSNSTGVGETAAPAMVLALQHPYPNPFNPTTTLSFTLPEAGWARIEIFDISGRLIATPLDGELTGGAHRLGWTAENRASGIYFARLSYGDERRTRRLLLLK